MLRDHLIGRKKRHRQSILFIGLFLIYSLTIGIALLYGMRYAGIGAIGILFVISAWILDTVLE